jgi:hypothetical protein
MRSSSAAVTIPSLSTSAAVQTVGSNAACTAAANSAGVVTRSPSQSPGQICAEADAAIIRHAAALLNARMSKHTNA